MCHGACWTINKLNDKHGPIWKQWMARAHNAFLRVPIGSRCHDYKIQYKFEYHCMKCDVAVKRHSKSLGDRKVCGRCKGPFTLFRVTRNGQKVAVSGAERPALNAFSSFVKANYGKYRVAGTTHAQVMKTLSVEYKALPKPIGNELSDVFGQLNLGDGLA